MGRRVIILVLDSLGIGEMPDAALFGDEGSNTLKSISRSPRFHIPHLLRMGLGRVDGVDYLPAEPHPIAAWGRMRERSKGKDTTIGHWELAGVVSEKPLPTYPEGFPPEVLEAFCRATGRDVLCNLPFSGTEVIRLWGEEHMKTGKLIVYTSGDSVFQIAAHERTVPVEELYRYCKIARDILQGEHAVGRVIARPFTGTPEEGFTRTSRRRDFSLTPPAETLLDAAKAANLSVKAVGKICDIFASRGITEAYKTASNREGMEKTLALLEEDFEGILFTNLVDFDSMYGHRNDVDGYAAALSDFDAFLPRISEAMKKEDLLLITADHGCDPATPSTDHSREYVPVIAYGNGVVPQSLGTRESFCDLAETCARFLSLDRHFSGQAFWA
ncbi:MAG: phosphopentomutase [Clostridia bacterium]|nr:phosphopentomutase [Clostridia bacterium]